MRFFLKPWQKFDVVSLASNHVLLFPVLLTYDDTDICLLALTVKKNTRNSE